MTTYNIFRHITDHQHHTAYTAMKLKVVQSLRQRMRMNHQGNTSFALHIRSKLDLWCIFLGIS